MTGNSFHSNRGFSLHFLEFFQEITKFGILTHPSQINGTRRTITLFGNDQFRLIFLFRIGEIILITIQKRYYIGVLFDGAGFSRSESMGLWSARCSQARDN